MLGVAGAPIGHHGAMAHVPWTTLGEQLRIETPYATFVVEELEDDAGRRYEWARLEKPDSLLLVIEHDGDILLPPPTYRPGIGRWSLDLPGGRLEGPGGVAGAAGRIVERELGVAADDLLDVELLEPAGLAIDSSTSSARLFVARGSLRPDVELGPSVRRQRSDEISLHALDDVLDCLQCRSALDSWRRRR
jgi:hypothetical protein